MAQVRQVVSESLQATIRRLLPSQQGFTEDLQASNVITPIIDLTPTAEGSSTSAQLAQAINFGGITAFRCANNTQTLANTAGFWRVRGAVTLVQSGTTGPDITVSLSDGLSTKVIFEYEDSGSLGDLGLGGPILDFTVFLRSGDSLSATSGNTFSFFIGSSQQIADVNGNPVTPTGFSPS